MRIKLTNLDALDRVIAKLDAQWPLGEYNENFIKYCVPSIKERLAKGEVIFLESVIDNTNFGVCQVLSYWSLNDVPTDEEYLKQDNEQS